jgi:hypothetical protein
MISQMEQAPTSYTGTRLHPMQYSLTSAPCSLRDDIVSCNNIEMSGTALRVCQKASKLNGRLLSAKLDKFKNLTGADVH